MVDILSPLFDRDPLNFFIYIYFTLSSTRNFVLKKIITVINKKVITVINKLSKFNLWNII